MLRAPVAQGMVSRLWNSVGWLSAGLHVLQGRRSLACGVAGEGPSRGGAAEHRLQGETARLMRSFRALWGKWKEWRRQRGVLRDGWSESQAGSLGCT